MTTSAGQIVRGAMSAAQSDRSVSSRMPHFAISPALPSLRRSRRRAARRRCERWPEAACSEGASPLPRTCRLAQFWRGNEGLLLEKWPGYGNEESCHPGRREAEILRRSSGARSDCALVMPALGVVADLEDDERSILGRDRVRRCEQRRRPLPVNRPTANIWVVQGPGTILQRDDPVVYLTGHRAIATWSGASDGEVYAVSSK